MVIFAIAREKVRFSHYSCTSRASVLLALSRAIFSVVKQKDIQFTSRFENSLSCVNNSTVPFCSGTSALVIERFTVAFPNDQIVKICIRNIYIPLKRANPTRQFIRTCYPPGSITTYSVFPMTKAIPFGEVSTGLTLNEISALSPVHRTIKLCGPPKLGVTASKLVYTTGVTPPAPPNVTLLNCKLGLGLPS
jgi:hypothetical protein